MIEKNALFEKYWERAMLVVGEVSTLLRVVDFLFQLITFQLLVPIGSVLALLSC